MQTRLPLNNLNTFAAAAEQLSFQQAAEVLYVTPSAVSHQIRNLEAILGFPLFDRLDKRVRLTAQGEKLFADIRAPLKELHEASRRALRGVEHNSLALSVAPVIATGWLVPRLKDFYARYPEINLSVIATTELVDFSADPFDASIRMGRGDWENTVSYRLFNREIVAVCHPTMLQAHQRPFSVSELTRAARIQNASLPTLWNEWFQSAAVEPPAAKNIHLQVQNSAQMIEVLQSADCVGLIDRNFIANDIRSGRLAIACDHVLADEVGYFLTAPQTAQSHPALQSFREWLDIQLAVTDKTAEATRDNQ